jgi:G3E family GTPase
MVTKSIQFTVVNSDGIMKPSPILKQYFTKDGQVKYDSVATILDCSSSTGDPTCINELFKSNFQIMANGKFFLSISILLTFRFC